MYRRLIGRKHSCVQSETLQKIATAALLYWVLTSSQIEARKKLDPTSTVLNEDVTLKSRRSPLYESRNNLHLYQLVSDQSLHPTQDTPLDHSHDSQGQPHPSRYPFILKKKPRPYFRNAPQLYTIEGAKGTPRPTFLVTPRSFGGGEANSSPVVAYYSTPKPLYENHLPNQGLQKYAFAYAVRPTDGQSTVADDFSLSHKESRDGKLTTGEYKVLLPDGRLQIVRYTADGKSGFKADVTYKDKGLEHSHEDAEHAKPLNAPTIEQQRQYFIPSSTASPLFKSNILYSTKQLRTHPSLAPSLVYSQAGSDAHHLQHSYVSPTPIQLNSVAPTPDLGYKGRSNPFTFKRQRPTPTYDPYNRLADSSPTSFQKIPPPTPQGIYDKINIHTAHYAPVLRGQRAGPATTAHTEPSVVQGQPPTLTHFDDDTHNHLPLYKIALNPSGPTRSPYTPLSPTFSKRLPPVAHAPEHSDYDAPPLYAHPFPTTFYGLQKQNQFSNQVIYSSPPLQPLNKSGLVPFEIFKAGPSESPPNEHEGLHVNDHLDHHGHSNEHSYMEQHNSHFYLDEAHHNHGDAGHHPSPVHSIDAQFPKIPKTNFPLVKSSLATFTSNLAYRRGGSLEPSLYSKSKSGIPVGRRQVKSSVAGLVYLESPAVGPRPIALRVKEQLPRHDNIPRPKTTTHPYQLGSKDYGNNVGYSPTSDPETYKTIRKTFAPSQQISPEAHHHDNSRDYLYGEGRESLIGY